MGQSPTNLSMYRTRALRRSPWSLPSYRPRARESRPQPSPCFFPFLPFFFPGRGVHANCLTKRIWTENESNLFKTDSNPNPCPKTLPLYIPHTPPHPGASFFRTLATKHDRNEIDVRCSHRVFRSRSPPPRDIPATQTLSPKLVFLFVIYMTSLFCT